MSDAGEDWIEVDDSPEALLDLLAERGWGDGLPVVAPTAARIDRMLKMVDAHPDEAIAVLPPRNGAATVRAIAVNAVLAGCPPEVMPVLVVAARALARPELNLDGVQATTHPVAPLVIIHGRAGADLGFNGGLGAFGPGCRANAAVGRAVRFLLMHVGGARPGAGDASTQGQPSKYTFCIAENAADSPWPPYAWTKGVTADSAVTVACTENPHNVHDMWSRAPAGILEKMATVVAQLGSNNAPVSFAEVFVVLCPEHAVTMAEAGWAREDVQRYLFERARLPARQMRAAFDPPLWEPWMHAVADDAVLPLTGHPDNYRILVAGGPGKHSSVLLSWGVTKSVTLPLVP
ncbi:MAG TPA: hypothetical protein VKH17_01165 [Acidimicrobiia bacterium]|nr:hypothetical protein [Acidimicrobiia bacterium]